ncbi:unnamed protein product, partial [Leptidea sinapis]
MEIIASRVHSRAFGGVYIQTDCGESNMCLWLLTACLGLLPAQPQAPIVIIQGVPSPILQPTTAATTAATTKAPNTTANPTTMPPPPMSSMSTISTSPPMPPTSPTTASPATTRMTAATTSSTMTTPRPTSPGQLPIDPRQGSTQAPSAQFRVPQIDGYTAQNPSYDMAVKFPREKRSLQRTNPYTGYSFHDFYSKRHSITKRQSCRCVSADCYAMSNWTRILLRDYNEYNNMWNCTVCSGRICYSRKRTSELRRISMAGNNFNKTKRLRRWWSVDRPTQCYHGEWDAAGTYEPIPFQEYTVAKVFTHPSYNQNTLQYDITVIRLSSSVPFTPMAGAAATINRACLPPSSTTTYTGRRCWVSGWGKDMFGVQGQYQQILKEVDVPIVAPATCQSQLQAARLGPSYVLDTTSFICAGGEPSKDSCT